ncbi:hypothetical protein BFJ70_g6909 [Fusarium oxysporum]|nr:hypothetical protein BFJ70_g6909 [Fusarium oxysporum]
MVSDATVEPEISSTNGSRWLSTDKAARQRKTMSMMEKRRFPYNNQQLHA